MVALDLDVVRLFLHVLAACIWVGGQITLAALVPVLRGHGREVTRTAARAFNRVAWPAFGVLVLTGIWNVAADQDGASSAWKHTLDLKLALVVVSGVTAFLHARARSPRAIAVLGALTGLSALAALLVGIMLAEGAPD